MLRRTLTVALISTLAPLALAQTGPALRERAAKAAKPTLSSPYIPLDSWIYPAAVRLYELGYLPTLYLDARPWTRASLAHALEISDKDIQDEGDFINLDALDIYESLRRELAPELNHSTSQVGAESIYTRFTSISGPILNDSFHLGQTIVNDYGRPYQSGFNNITGFSARAAAGRFSLYLRDEYQHSPAATGYSTSVFNTLNVLDNLAGQPNPSIPQGAIPAQNNIRIVEANLSAHLWSHEVSFGKSDAWYSPNEGASMAWSNNAENIYAFRINRVEPLYVPGLSRYTGMFRYDFMVGSLKGHSAPNDPWIHAEKISFKPTADLEFGFERSVIWGGKGHAPITIASFLRSFFSVASPSLADKASRLDPGARFSTFDFTWRIPWQDHLITLYTDSLAHDNVFPISNPGRSGWLPGIYLSRLFVPRLDLRLEGGTTNVHDIYSQGGQFLYWENQQHQGYTNKSQILGNWLGRENTGGQAWITWHISPEQSVQFEYRRDKAATDFIPGGTIQQQFGINTQFRLTPDIELKANVHGELWKAPLIATGIQRDYIVSGQFTYYPHIRLAAK